ncbi:hypothetical protein EYF80_037528 [Liparis tanakae]|uniref:Uncharacterized protein n=1 Tax=Liparis tanakae TaxID=230148 RepID=A0A4Z2GHW0_9TELE|nr:hypothetical protein EYF80_037528 [Liparis tanakae]
MALSNVTNHTESLFLSPSWDPRDALSGFGKGRGGFHRGGTVSEKTRKETGGKQRKRKGTQWDGACPSLILVQPESCGQWRHRRN